MANVYGDFTEFGEGKIGSEQWRTGSLQNYQDQLNIQNWKSDLANAKTEQERINAKAGLAAAKKKLDMFSGFLGKITTHKQLLGEQREEMLSGFRTGAESGIARQLEASTRAATLRSQRAGLGRAGLGGRAAALGEMQLRGAGEAAFNQFQTRLGSLQSQYMNETLQGEFQFMNEMTKQDALMKFEEDMIRLRAKLQTDRDARNAMWNLAGDILGGGGEAAGYAAGGF